MWTATIALFLTWPYGFLAWLWGGAFAKTLEGNRLFAEGKWAEAGTKYRDALVDAPTEEVLHFNLGTALYEQKLYDKAVEELEKATGLEDPLQAAQVHYNLGNCRFRQAEEALRTNQVEEYGKLLLQAIESYTRSLEFNPQDQDAKFNLELARKRFLERPKPPEQPPPQKPSPEQSEQLQSQRGSQESKPSPQGSQQPEPESSSQQAQEQTAQAAEQSSKGDQGPPEGQEEKSGVLMSPEEAQRLLDSLEDEEKEARRKLLSAPIEGSRNVEKDW